MGAGATDTAVPVALTVVNNYWPFLLQKRVFTVKIMLNLWQKG